MCDPSDEHSTGHIGVSEARESFAELVNRAAYGHERVLVARRGRPIAAIVPIEDVELLEKSPSCSGASVAPAGTSGS